MTRQPAHYQSLEYERIKTIVADMAAIRQSTLRVLDFGCGPGKYATYLASKGYAVTGVDSNLDYVSKAVDRGYATYLPSEFFAASGLEFDVILLSHLIEHLSPADLVDLIPRLCSMLSADGRLIIVTPTFGERFYHDFSHVRPYLPQSVRHAFGQHGAPLSFGERNLVELVDVYFFKDPYRTRSWRSFYVGGPLAKSATRTVNAAFDLLWRLSGGRVGIVASWLGVYRAKAIANPR
jgi:SAM-dependent methyltransferase